MIKTYSFDIFGVKYRTKQFAAIPALEIMNNKDVAPTSVLSRTEVFSDFGEWISLEQDGAINNFVVDKANAIPPRMVLDGLVGIISDKSFGFIRGWKSARVPRRFLNNAPTVDSDHLDPVITVLITEKLATMRELEEYYSLEDAFKMFDSVIVKGINSALSTEAAMNK